MHCDYCFLVHFLFSIIFWLHFWVDSSRNSYRQKHIHMQTLSNIKGWISKLLLHFWLELSLRISVFLKSDNYITKWQLQLWWEKTIKHVNISKENSSRTWHWDFFFHGVKLISKAVCVPALFLSNTRKNGHKDILINCNAELAMYLTIKRVIAHESNFKIQNGLIQSVMGMAFLKTAYI